MKGYLYIIAHDGYIQLKDEDKFTRFKWPQMIRLTGTDLFNYQQS
jgi:hypothetical protein